MATNSVDLKALKEAVVAVLRDVPGLTKIESRYGGSEAWIDNPRPYQSFWEVTVQAAAEAGAGMGTVADETVLVRIEGFMPFSYADRTEDRWDALLKAVRDRLRSYPTLACAIEGLHGAGLVQMPQNAIRAYSDVKSTKIVHYCRIEVPFVRRFGYSVSSTL